MQTLRTMVHLSFDAAAAFLYSGSIAIVLAAVAFIFTQILALGLATAVVSFVFGLAILSRMLWRRHRANSRTRNLFA
jgi:hypothetical protein